MLNDDGVMLEIEDKDKPNEKWSDLVDANMTKKIDYLCEFTSGDCKVAAIKAFV